MTKPYKVVRLSDTEWNRCRPPEWCVASAEETGPKGERDVIAFFHDEKMALWFAEHFPGERGGK